MRKKKRGKLVKPLGFRVLTGYLGFLAVFYLLFMFFPSMLFFGTMLQEVIVRLLTLLIVAVLVVLTYGFRERKKWAYGLAIVWFVYEIINAVVSNFFVSGHDLVAPFMQSTALFIVLADLVILWYLYSRRDYFLSRRKLALVTRQDKLLVTFLIIFVVMLVMLSVNATVELYNDTKVVSSQVVEEFSGKSYEQALLLCSTKSGTDKDLCYVVLVVAYEEATRFDCSNVEYPFFKSTCLLANSKV